MARKQESAKSAAVDADGGVALHLERGQRVRLADQLYGQIFDQIASGA